MAPHKCVCKQISGVVDDGDLGWHLRQAALDGLVAVGLGGVLKPSRERKGLPNYVDQEDLLLPKPFQGAGLSGSGAAIN